MATWFTSDLHFGHKNILKFSEETRKGFGNIDEHDEHLIDLWNSQVDNGDTIYILGDMFLCSKGKMRSILPRLNGKKHLIRGNHDHALVKEVSGSDYFEEIVDYKIFRKDGFSAVLFHFPILEWDGIHRGFFHLHGHTHGSVQMEGRALDVGIDNRVGGDMKFWEWGEIVEWMEGRGIRGRY